MKGQPFDRSFCFFWVSALCRKFHPNFEFSSPIVNKKLGGFFIANQFNYWVFHLQFFTTLPETNSSHLKMDGWNTPFFWGPAHFQVRTVSCREGKSWVLSVRKQRSGDFFLDSRPLHFASALRTGECRLWGVPYRKAFALQEFFHQGITRCWHLFWKAFVMRLWHICKFRTFFLFEVMWAGPRSLTAKAWNPWKVTFRAAKGKARFPRVFCC